MTYIAYPPNWWMATDLKTQSTYIAEPARRGSKKLIWSCIPARRDVIPRPERRINRGFVPLHLRRAAATHFGWPQ